MDIDPNDFDFDIEDQFARMVEATKLLREIEAIQRHMRWQFGDPGPVAELAEAINDAQTGWLASNC